jgi:hypothetical protein
MLTAGGELASMGAGNSAAGANNASQKGCSDAPESPRPFNTAIQWEQANSVISAPQRRKRRVMSANMPRHRRAVKKISSQPVINKKIESMRRPPD